MGQNFQTVSVILLDCKLSSREFWRNLNSLSLHGSWSYEALLYFLLHSFFFFHMGSKKRDWWGNRQSSYLINHWVRFSQFGSVGKFQDQGAGRFSVWWRHSSWLIVSSLHGRKEGTREAPAVPFIKPQSHSGGLWLSLQSLDEGLPSDTTIVGIRLQHGNLKGLSCSVLGREAKTLLPR